MLLRWKILHNKHVLLRPAEGYALLGVFNQKVITVKNLDDFISEPYEN